MASFREVMKPLPQSGKSLPQSGKSLPQSGEFIASFREVISSFRGRRTHSEEYLTETLLIKAGCPSSTADCPKWVQTACLVIFVCQLGPFQNLRHFRREHSFCTRSRVSVQNENKTKVMIDKFVECSASPLVLS